jgi:hypothetical protein
MRDRPEIAALLALAEGERDGALVARCHAIAERERRGGDAPYHAIAAELCAICGEGDPPALLARLAAALREGRFDRPGAERTRVERLLWWLTTLKLQESNPAFLDGVKFQ